MKWELINVQEGWKYAFELVGCDETVEMTILAKTVEQAVRRLKKVIDLQVVDVDIEGWE